MHRTSYGNFRFGSGCCAAVRPPPPEGVEHPLYAGPSRVKLRNGCFHGL